MRQLPLANLLMLGMISACGPNATPVVIRDQRVSETRTAVLAPTLTPTGPTPVPTLTSTPYNRPTDDSSLELDRAVVRVGNQTITLGQFRQRVRFERFMSLDSARRLIEELGLPKLLRDPAQNKALEYVMA